ncbi:MAG TPA: type II toxin-antitoxin system VapC family toxin [Opitutaceae bacterium]|nr:type II toxin-antitoxin system VapC family toxin [Opitutaceae bacterium]
MLYLPDTNACSYFMRGHDVLVPQWLAAAPAIRLSVIVVAELEYGAAKAKSPKQHGRLQGLTATLPHEPFQLADAAEFGRLRALLEQQGEMIGPLDLLIAAQALRLGATVVTHNVREFRRVPRLKVEDWQTR